VRGEVRDRDPRQDEEPRIVGQEAEIPAPGRGRPSDEAIARPQVPRRRRPRQTRDGAASPPDQILQVRADRLLSVPIASPSTGVNPIVLATLRPASVAHMLDPLPRCSTIVRPAAALASTRGRIEAMYS
jgi:hypothetical protein